jgi:hypothetical protein
MFGNDRVTESDSSKIRARMIDFKYAATSPSRGTASLQADNTLC